MEVFLKYSPERGGPDGIRVWVIIGIGLVYIRDNILGMVKMGLRITVVRIMLALLIIMVIFLDINCSNNNIIII